MIEVKNMKVRLTMMIFRYEFQ